MATMTQLYSRQLVTDIKNTRMVEKWRPHYILHDFFKNDTFSRTACSWSFLVQFVQNGVTTPQMLAAGRAVALQLHVLHTPLGGCSSGAGRSAGRQEYA